MKRKTRKNGFYKEMKELKMLPTGVNPLPYIFWFMKTDFKKFVIVFILISLIGLFYSGSLVLRTKYLEIEKQKVELDKLIKKQRGHRR